MEILKSVGFFPNLPRNTERENLNNKCYKLLEKLTVEIGESISTILKKAFLVGAI